MKTNLILILILIIAAYFYYQGTDHKSFQPSSNGKKATQSQVEGISGTDFVQTGNYANRKLNYYYYIPSTLKNLKNQTIPFLVCVPGLSGSGRSFVKPSMVDFAEKERIIIIAPSFQWDKKNWETKKSYQYPKAWSGKAFKAILQKFEYDHKYKSSGLFLYGFSAGAQFVLRFSLWQPGICRGVVAHAPGGTILPTRWNKVPYLITVGKSDRSRLEKCEQFYKKAKALKMTVSQKFYPGGHSLPGIQVQDALQFFKEQLK